MTNLHKYVRLFTSASKIITNDYGNVFKKEKFIMSTQSTAKGGWLDKTFRLSEKHTTVKREFLAGLTTFLTMV